MSDILLCYTVEDTDKADAVMQRIYQDQDEPDVERYPIIGNNLWESLADQSIQNKRILLISTAEMLGKYSDEIRRQIFLSSTGFNSYAFIVFDDRAEMMLAVNSRSYAGAKSSFDILREDQVPAYVNAVRQTKKHRRYQIKTGRGGFVILTTAGVSFLGFGVGLLQLFFSKGNITALDNAVKALILVPLALSVVCFIVAVIFLAYDIFNRRRKSDLHAEKRDFAINLEQSLTKSTVSLDEENLRLLERRMNSRADLSERDGEERGGSAADRRDMLPTIADDSGYQPLGHLIMNWDQMKGYYDISKQQARTAFRWAIFFCIIGIFIILLAVLSPLIPPYANSETPLITIIGAIGGAVTELFAGTILLVYSKSLSQMNLYHQALSEYQSYLSRVNLVSKLSTVEKRDAMYEKIIENELKLAASAPAAPKEEA